jgi:hypothetical protein
LAVAALAKQRKQVLMANVVVSGRTSKRL